MAERLLTLRYLRYWHTRFNNLLFGGKLKRAPIVVRDLKRDEAVAMFWPFDGHIELDHDVEKGDHARACLLHEMVHQWQHENNLPVNHGPAFEQWRTECFARTGLTI